MLNQDPNAFLFDSIAAAGESNDRADRVKQGEHIALLNKCEFKGTQDYGQIIAVEYVVVESSVADYAGQTASEGFFIQKSDATGGKAARQQAYSMAKAAVLSLGGNPDDPEVIGHVNGRPLTKGEATVKQMLTEMTRADQPWRGLALRLSASKRTSGPKSKNPGREYINVRYSPVTQTAQQIGEARKRLEGATLAAAPAQTIALPPMQSAPAAAQMTPAVQFQPAPSAPATPAANPFAGVSLLK